MTQKMDCQPTSLHVESFEVTLIKKLEEVDLHLFPAHAFYLEPPKSRSSSGVTCTSVLHLADLKSDIHIFMLLISQSLSAHHCPPFLGNHKPTYLEEKDLKGNSFNSFKTQIIPKGYNLL